MGRLSICYLDARKSRDNTDEAALFKQLGAFNISGESSSALIKIATRDIGTSEIQKSLLNVEMNGESCMEDFLNRIIAKDTSKVIVLEFHKTLTEIILKHSSIFPQKLKDLKERKKSLHIKQIKNTVELSLRSILVWMWIKEPYYVVR